MSINTSIELAFSGLRATQAGLDVVSQNIANAGSTATSGASSIPSSRSPATAPRACRRPAPSGC